MSLKFRLCIGICALSYSLSAQIEAEVAPPDHLKSIVFKGNTSEDQFPIVPLGTPVLLSFDDLNADEADYYYKIVHCNYDWTPSDLLKSQYIDGVDNQRIMNYENSVTTLQSYSHYELRLPNRQTKFRFTGNYILKIYNNYDELMFSRRFIIYKEQVAVGVTLKRSRDLQNISAKQVVQFVINTNGARLVNPQQEIKVAIVQNHRWENTITNIRPQFFSGNRLIYKYDKETMFNGGNEFLFFDNKEIRVANNSVTAVRLYDLYNHYLFTNRSRAKQPYTYNPDINGDFAIRTLDGDNSDTQADYARIHFSLDYNNETIGLNRVYVIGKFNNYELTEENRLTFNEKTAHLEASLLLKQGFYNYKYVMVDDNGNVDETSISGNYAETENNYLVIVYYRDFGALYDSVIGIGSGSSTTISN